MRARLLAALIACVTAGCGESDRPEAAPTADVEAEAPVDSAGLTACDVVTEAELESILALELEPARLTNRVPGVVSQCRWDLPGNPQRGVSISLYEQRGLDDYRAVPGSQAVTGLGDDAVWNGEYGQLAVASGERLLSLGLLLENPPRIVAAQIARLALPRLTTAPGAADTAAPAAPARP